MAKKEATFPNAAHDFYKSNGVDVAIYDWGPSLTRQEFAEECDINQIMARYESGELPQFNRPREPMYLDLTAMPATLQESLNLMNDASAAFMTLPAQVRKEFDNDPLKFVDFASDPENLSQMRTWGLAPPEEVPPAPQRVEIVNPPPAPPEAPPAPPAPKGA